MQGSYSLPIPSLCILYGRLPNGKRIAFVSDKSGNYDIWIYDYKNKQLRQLTIDHHLDTNPAWSPDGKRIAFISTRSGKMAIWIKNIEKGDLQKLTPFSDRDIEYKDLNWR